MVERTKKRKKTKRISRNRKYKKRTNRKTNEKRYNKQKTKKRINKNNLTRKKRSKNNFQSGGDLIDITDDIFSNIIIPFLPNSFILKNYKKYLKMISLKELQEIIEENIEYKKSPTIQKIFNYSTEKLKKPEEIDFDWKNIVCKDVLSIDQDYLIKKLFLHILDCNDQQNIDDEQITNDNIVKNKNWFDICMGLDSVDDLFEGYF
jgi:hypothetical protein